MGWFSPVKGSYPSLAQVDKTLPVDDSVKALERGMIVALAPSSGSEEGVWKVATADDAKLLYVALQDLSDPTAGYAGDAFNPDPNVTLPTNVPNAGVPGKPRITALDLIQDAEYETSVFDNTKTYAVGDALYVANGKLTNTGTTIVGYVTLAPKDRWINNAVAVPTGADRRLAYRTGATEKVIRFKTAL